MKETEEPPAHQGNLIRELYFSVFMLFYSYFSRQWSQHMNAVKGAVGISLIECLLLMSAMGWIEIIRHSHLKFDRWVFAAITAAICIANISVLVTHGAGLEFRSEFERFSKTKQVALYISAIAIVLITAATFSFSAFSYRQTWISH